MQRSRLSRRELDEDLSRSLDALGTDVVDLFYLHRDDPEVPVAEVVDILDEFVEAGRVRFVGCSNWRPKRIGEAVEYARSQSKSPFVANQMLWNIGSRHMLEPADRTMVVFDDEARSLHETTGMAAISYSSQANGFFTKLDRDRREGPSPRLAGGATDSGIEGSPYNTASNRALYEVVRSVADRSNLPASAVVLRYLLQQPIPTFPVVGCRTQAQLEDSMAAVACHIPEELFREVVRAVEASR